MKLTFTKLDTYKKCPLRYRLRYQEKLPEVARGGRNLSLVLHQALRSFLFTEQKFSVVVEGTEVTGQLDCAIETEEGLELVDFKFTREIPEDLDPLQLQVYALGLRTVTGAAPDVLVYHYLRQERKVSFPGGEAAVEEGKERVVGLAQQLQGDRSFSPQVGAWCGSFHSLYSCLALVVATLQLSWYHWV